MDISIPLDHFSINDFKKNKLIFSELFLKIFPFVISTFGEHLLGIFNFSNKFFKGGVHSVEYGYLHPLESCRKLRTLAKVALI